MKNDTLIIKGAKENNLKNISLEIPKNKLVVMTGLSGSGRLLLPLIQSMQKDKEDMLNLYLPMQDSFWVVWKNRMWR